MNQMDDLMQTAKEAGIDLDLISEDEGQIWYVTTEGLQRFAQLVAKKAVEAEREANAQLAERTPKTAAYGAGLAVQDHIASAIRARASD